MEGIYKKLSLPAAVWSYYSLYYRHMFAAYIKGLSLLHPCSFTESLRMVLLIHKVRGYTAVFVPRLAALHKLGRQIDLASLPGDIVECGVYNGGSAALLASICCKQSSLTRDIWLFDSFEGLPKPTEKDGEKAQHCGWWCHGDLSKVREILRKLHIPEHSTHIVKGWFQDTFPVVQVREIALLHIDADWYESVKLCLEKFYDNILPGGYIVIDDYGHWEGCRKATDEFLRERAIEVQLTRVDYTGLYFQKPGNSQ